MSMRVPFVGWVANCIDPETLAAEENIESLKAWMPGPLLGVMPHGFGSYSANLDLILQK
jgi:dethiobiotin synthetase